MSIVRNGFPKRQDLTWALKKEVELYRKKWGRGCRKRLELKVCVRGHGAECPGLPSWVIRGQDLESLRGEMWPACQASTLDLVLPVAWANKGFLSRERINPKHSSYS